MKKNKTNNIPVNISLNQIDQEHWVRDKCTARLSTLCRILTNVAILILVHKHKPFTNICLNKCKIVHFYMLSLFLIYCILNFYSAQNLHT